MDFSEWVLYLTISVRITSCTSCPYDEFFLLSRIVHSGKSKSLCSLLKWLGFYPCLSIVTRRCDVCPHPLVIGMTDINLQPSELCSLILSCNSISPSSTLGSIFFLSWNLTLKVLYSYELVMYVAFVGDLFTHLWYVIKSDYSQGFILIPIRTQLLFGTVLRGPFASLPRNSGQL